MISLAATLWERISSVVALVALGAATAVGVYLMTPGELADPDLRGNRGYQRARVLAANPFLAAGWPAVRVATWYVRMLPGRRWRTWVARKLLEAAYPIGMDVDEFAGTVLACGALALTVAFALDQMQPMGFRLYLVFGVFGIVFPLFRLVEVAAERLKSINRGLPAALDLVSMAMVAGSDFVGALQQVVSRWSRKADPLYEELNAILADLRFGQTRRQALEAFALRTPTEMVRTFVGSVIEAERRGTPLVDALVIQAEVARVKRFQLAELLAGRAETLVLLPLILIMSAGGLVILGGIVLKIQKDFSFK